MELEVGPTREDGTRFGTKCNTVSEMGALGNGPWDRGGGWLPAARFFGSEFQLVVETLNDSIRQWASGAKPGHQQGAFFAQHAFDILHGLDA